MKQTKPIYPQPDLNPKVISGDVDVFFDKKGKGMLMVNSDPSIWELSLETTNVLQCHGIETMAAAIAILKPAYKVGETYKWSYGPMYIDILDAKLIRLENVTEEDAQRTVLEKTENGYRHYCPKKLFPAEVLKKQQSGHPFMKDARGSFFTQWVDKYGVLDVPINPWIWRYEFRFNINKSLPDK